MLTYDLDRLRKFNVFMNNLRLDVTPDVIFKPRFITEDNRTHLIEEIQGFSFYIDYLGDDDPPALMLMKTYNLTSKTIGAVEGVPHDLLIQAVKRDGIKDYAGMFPIDEGVEGWIKEGLGLN